MRRALFLLFFLAFLSAQAQAAVCVRPDGAAALLEEDGTEIISPGTYGDILPLGDGLFAARSGDRWALLDDQGIPLTQAFFDELRMDAGLLLARRDGMWGLLNPNGTEASAFRYSRIVPNGTGGAWAQVDRSLIILANGTETLAELRVQEIARTATEGLLPLQLSSGEWGYCDASGQLRIPAAYEYAGNFVSGTAVVVQDGRYGAIDAQGAWIAPAEYDFLELSPAGFLLAVRDQTVQVLRGDGSEIAAYEGPKLHAALVSEGYALLDEGSLRIYDKSGVLKEELSPSASVLEGLDGQLILSEGMWGEACVRLLGTDQAYQNLYPLGTANSRSVYACMQANAARYMNDLLGEVQISVDMETARYGIVDASGALLLECNYHSIEALADNRFLVRTQKEWQMIDAEGTVYWSFPVTQSEEPSF